MYLHDGTPLMAPVVLGTISKIPPLKQMSLARLLTSMEESAAAPLYSPQPVPSYSPQPRQQAGGYHAADTGGAAGSYLRHGSSNTGQVPGYPSPMTRQQALPGSPLAAPFSPQDFYQPTYSNDVHNNGSSPPRQMAVFEEASPQFTQYVPARQPPTHHHSSPPAANLLPNHHRSPAYGHALSHLPRPNYQLTNGTGSVLISPDKLRIHNDTESSAGAPEAAPAGGTRSEDHTAGPSELKEDESLYADTPLNSSLASLNTSTTTTSPPPFIISALNAHLSRGGMGITVPAASSVSPRQNMGNIFKGSIVSSKCLCPPCQFS